MSRRRADNAENTAENRPVLRRDEDGLCLVWDGMVLRGDLSRKADRLQSGRLQQELLYRAAKFRHAEGPLMAIDATAGLGEDSLILAAAGYNVTLLEHNPVIADLLEDALQQAAADPALSEIAGRMHLVRADSIAFMSEFEGPSPDLIYLDPMFPEKQKNSLTGKKLQMFQMLEIPCGNEEQLLQAALDLQPKRIVIKRPLKGPHLAGRKPSYAITGKTVRYDCIVL